MNDGGTQQVNVADAPTERLALAAMAVGSLICTFITVMLAPPFASWTFLWALSGLAAIGLASLMMLRSRAWTRWVGLALLVLALLACALAVFG